jgi:hypothetical protein
MTLPYIPTHHPFTKVLNTLNSYGFKQPMVYPITLPNLTTRNRSFTAQEVSRKLVSEIDALHNYCRDNNIPVTNTDSVQLADELAIFHHVMVDRLYNDGLRAEPISPEAYLDTMFVWLSYSGRIPFYLGWVDALFNMICDMLEEVCPNDPKLDPMIMALSSFVLGSEEKKRAIYDGLAYLCKTYPVNKVSDYVDLIHSILSDDALNPTVL